MSNHTVPAPIIARLGGLPASIMDAFSTSLGDHLEAIRQTETSLQAARAELVDSLFTAIHNADPEKRHALLAVKRDCFNGRPLNRYSHQPVWRFVEDAAGLLAERVLSLEQQLSAAQSQFESSFENEVRYQQGRLSAVLEDPLFQCGLAIASSVVATEVSRLRGARPEDYGRREKRLAATLLRYLSRAALKLSPFSTFTPIGRCQIDEGSAPPVLASESWQHNSLVRLRRHVFDRCMDMLLRYRPWREQIDLVLNNSAVQLKDGRLLFRRSGHYRHDEEENKLRHHRESLVRVQLDSSLVLRLKTALASRPLPYRGLAAILASDAGNESVAIEQLDYLIDIGYLCVVPPWNTDEGHVEKAIVCALRRLPATPELVPFLTKLERLVELEDGVFSSRDPVADFLDMGRIVDDLLRIAAQLGGLPPDIKFPKISFHDVYQDVWCAPQSDDSAPIVHVGRSSLEMALHSVQPLVSYAWLFDHRVDFLYTLGASLRRTERGRVPVLEAFANEQSLWQEFMKFEAPAQRTANWRDTWNPLQLQILNDLAAARQAAVEALARCLNQRPDGSHVSVDLLNTVLEQVPACFAEGHSGACLFLQPASGDGTVWMLNRLKEGTGRFASRYTPLMPHVLQKHYQSELMNVGKFEINGEPVELLEVQHAQGDTLNVHAPQTPKILTLPGARASVSPDREVHLKDLLLSVEENEHPQIRDSQGRRHLPIYLGVGSHDYLPTLVKFLCTFGPTELMAPFPPPYVHEVDGVRVQERTTIGNVVLHRKSWRIPLPELHQCLELSRDCEIFAALHNWRRRRQVPDRVFASERVAHPMKGFRFKPQFIDFTSPLFIPILRTIVSTAEQYLLFSEMLPAADTFPKDKEGRRWALELLVDSISLRTPSTNLKLQRNDVAPQAKTAGFMAFVDYGGSAEGPNSSAAD